LASLREVFPVLASLRVREGLNTNINNF
jgi:hypothetical protein